MAETEVAERETEPKPEKHEPRARATWYQQYPGEWYPAAVFDPTQDPAYAGLPLPVLDINEYHFQVDLPDGRTAERIGVAYGLHDGGWHDNPPQEQRRGRDETPAGNVPEPEPEPEDEEPEEPEPEPARGRATQHPAAGRR